MARLKERHGLLATIRTEIQSLHAGLAERDVLVIELHTELTGLCNRVALLETHASGGEFAEFVRAGTPS